jgi:hypothetical protein
MQNEALKLKKIFVFLFKLEKRLSVGTTPVQDCTEMILQSTI